jgi:glucose-6-phosphate isomerase
MEGMIFENKNSLVRTSDFDKVKRKTSIELTKIKEAVNKKQDWYKALALPYDKKLVEEVQELAKQKHALGISAVVVIGIGGSILGTQAIYEALIGKLHDETQKIKVLFVDTVDTDAINDVLKITESLLKSEKNILLNIVTESGTTTETISNFEIFLELLKKHRKDYQKYIVVTTKKEKKLYQYALKYNFSTLEIQEGIGGRYSVFTPVGLFPLALTGIDIKKILKGAASMNDRCFKEISKNPAAQSAIDLYCNYKEGKYIHDLFIFSVDLESLGKWYRQLLAESIGKKYNTKGYKVEEGITPTVSIGSTDLHSSVQLYLSGPYNRFATFVKVEPKNKIKISKDKEFEEIIGGIQGKTLSDIMDAIYQGTKLAFIKGKRPFNQIHIRKKEHDLGQYMQYEMIKIIILAHLLNVNPFDQPNVEEYKQETRNILKK